MDKPALSNRLIASLDLARAVAAVYVVMHHVTEARGWTHGLGVAFRFGQEAVIVFFLLSGFVIFANERERALRPGGYYLRRLRRIYPVLIAAMVISALVELDNGDLFKSFSWPQMAGTLFSLQDIASLKPGVLFAPFLGNDPLWSLSYEVAFYAVFPLALMAWRRFPKWTSTAIGAICCISYAAYVAYPNHFALVGAYFLIWWTGAMAAEAYLGGGKSFRYIDHSYSWLLAMAGLSLAIVRLRGYHGLGYYPVLMARHFVVAALMVTVLFGPIGRWIASASSAFAKPAAAVASISFGLYAFHFPLLVLWHRAQTVTGFAVAVAVLLIASYLAEGVLPKILPKAPRD